MKRFLEIIAIIFGKLVLKFRFWKNESEKKRLDKENKVK